MAISLSLTLTLTLVHTVALALVRTLLTNVPSTSPAGGGYQV